MFIVIVITILVVIVGLKQCYKVINTHPMQAELDKINNAKTFWEVIYNDINHRDRNEPAECVLCSLCYMYCPAGAEAILKKYLTKTPSYTTTYCPAIIQQELSKFS